MATLRDEDVRLAAKRLADVILRLARDPAIKHSMLPSEYGIGDGVATNGVDETVISWSSELTHVGGSDAEGPIPLGFAIHESLIDRTSRTFPYRPKALSEIAQIISTSVMKNPILTHDKPHIVLGDATNWVAATTMLSQASLAHPDLKLRLAGSMDPGMHLEIAAKGARGVIGPSIELEGLVSALPTSPTLSWKRATSPQALAKRRDNGVPPMGRAIIQHTAIVWKPHDARPGSTGAEHILRPAAPTQRIVPIAIPDEARFDWRLDDWHEVTRFPDLDFEVQRALHSILVVNDRTLMQQLHLVRRKGRWVQRFAPYGDIPELSYGDADTLLKHRILLRRDNMLVASLIYYRLLEGLIATGYDSWKGVASIQRDERVPNGIKYECEGYSYWSRQGGNVVRLTSAGFAIERLGFEPKTPTLAKNGYAKQGLKPTDPLIAVLIHDGLVWPDFTRDIPSEMDGRVGVACDPEMDARQLPGPLGALYRAPPADRAVIQRYLRWKETHDQLPSFEEWRDEDTVDYC